MTLEDYQSERRLATLKGRVERCICSSCGSQLGLKQIVFSEYEDSRCEIFCHQCGRLEYGVEKEIYNAAKYFVEEFEVNLFSDIADNEVVKEKNVAYISKIITWALREMGYLDNNGFNVSPQKICVSNSESLKINDQQLNDKEGENYD